MGDTRTRLTRAAIWALAFTVSLTNSLPFSASALAQGSPRDVQAAIDSQCGTGVSEKVVRLEKKAQEDSSLVDYGAILDDARQVIRTAEPCADMLKGPCEGSDCTDGAWVFMEDAILVSEQYLGAALAAEHKTEMALDATREEFGIAASLCSSAHILDESSPYDLARIDLRTTLEKAAKFSKYAGSPVSDYAADLRACAQRTGSTAVIL